ncbi:MAG TPA: PA14 domain-containing protein, partial [Verrucomicrobiae bacterium]|nr:PA14 domain-containing protein [Verrucomicrobiae bacterium]
EPTTNSLLYLVPFPLTNTTTLKVKAFKAGFVDSGVIATTLVNSSALGHGTGLLGEYFSNQSKTFTNPPTPTLTRTDAVVNFDWGAGSPAPEISADNFTVRWTGSVQPLVSDTYTFYTMTDDGCRLWINNQQIINNWRARGASEQTGTFTMIGQQRYNIRLEYYETQGNAKASLSWANHSMEKAIIPQTQLYPALNSPPSVEMLAPTNGAVYTGQSLTFTASAACEFNLLDHVDFYTNGVFFGSAGNGSASQSNTLSLTATGLAPGNYSVKAIAVDLAGLAHTTASVNITIQSDNARYGLTNRMAVSPFLNMPPSLAGAMPPLLSLTGVFTNTANMTPTVGLIPYSVNVPQWTDYAVKTRYAAIPSHSAPYTPDQQIGFSPTGAWTFPDGSVFVQTFELATNDAYPDRRRRLETRLLVRGTNGAVYGVTYKWRPDDSDADLLAEGQYETVSVATATGTRTQNWYYPSKSDCFLCHTPATGLVLGLNTRQLNGNFSYASQTDNQLRTLNRLGVLNPALNEADIASYPRLSALNDTSASLEERFRSYLDVNCATCHRPGGSGVTTDARYETPLAKQNLINAPAARGNLGFDNAHIITPHDVIRSVLWQRMNTTNVLVKMPTLGHDQIDTNAVQLTAEWINSLR